MKVIVLVKATNESEANPLPSEAELREMGNYNEELAKAGVLLAAEGLQPSRKGKRLVFKGGSRSFVDGPFAETKELVAGFWIWQVQSMEEALEWARRMPNPYRGDGEVELRPVAGDDDLGEAFTPDLREQSDRVRARAEGKELT
ncbi:MAG: YciI family protein [Polyangiaceae bacterium]